MSQNVSMDLRYPKLMNGLISSEIERTLIAKVLYDPDVIDRVLDLSPGVFESYEYRVVFDSILDVYFKHKKVDLPLVAQDLKEKKLLDKIGGSYFLSGLIESEISGADVDLYKMKLVELANKRKALKKLTTLLQEFPERELYEISEELLQIQREIDNGQETKPTDLQILADRIIEEIEQEKERIYPTGLLDVDNYLAGGLRPGNLVVVGASTSTGKTSFMLSLLLKQSTPQLFITAEMSPEEIASRVLHMKGEVERQKKYEKEQILKLKRAKSTLKNQSIFIEMVSDYRKTCTLIRGYKQRYGITHAYIDYIQLLTGVKASSRVLELSLIADGLKQLALDTELIIVVASQLNREAKAEKPRLYHLRDSGAIEQAADVIFLLYRPELHSQSTYKGQNTEGICWVNIAKNRNGRTGEVKLAFLKKFMKFESLTRDIPF